MDKVWQAVNGTRTLLVLLGLVIAAALWAHDQSREIERLDRYGTSRWEADSKDIEKRIRRMEWNIWRLGVALDVQMQPPTGTDPGMD